jgi:hypothetical protein
LAATWWGKEREGRGEAWEAAVLLAMAVKGREVGGEPNGRVPSVSDREREERRDGLAVGRTGSREAGLREKKKKAELG